MINNTYSLLSVKVGGDYACFTRPEMKVERVSYPVMTPSAAKGLLESIFWKPEFSWIVREIQVLKPLQYFSIIRNEISARQSDRAAKQWRTTGVGGFYAAENRVQRHTLGLRDVEYIIKAEVAVKEGVEEDPAKFRDQFRRRVNRGRCFAMPYLGCREFVASFSPVSGDEQPIDLTMDIGSMLWRMEYAPDGSGRAVPSFFNARLERGVLVAPQVNE